MKKSNQNNNRMIGKNKLIIILLILFIVALLFVLIGIYIWPKINIDFDKPYSTVYLETGDIYFGKLSYFPRLALEDVYTIETITNPEDPTQTSLQVVPLIDFSWAPDKIVLIRDNVVFISRLGEDSQVMRAIRQIQNN